MPKKPSRWCAKCSKVHDSDCPARQAWVKPYGAKSGRGGRPWRRKREETFKADGFMCRSCGRTVTLHGALAGVCDHIIPKAEGGTDEPSNRQTLCKICSDEKTQAEAARGRVGSKPRPF